MFVLFLLFHQLLVSLLPPPYPRSPPLLPLPLILLFLPLLLLPNLLHSLLVFLCYVLFSLLFVSSYFLFLYLFSVMTLVTGHVLLEYGKISKRKGTHRLPLQPQRIVNVCPLRVCSETICLQINKEHNTHCVNHDQVHARVE